MNPARRGGRPRRMIQTPAVAPAPVAAEAAPGPTWPDEPAATQPAARPAPEAATAVPASRRRVRGDVGGHQMKLSTPQRPGFVRRWVNDEPGRITDMQARLAYDFVEEQAIRSDQPGSRISRVVGKDADGKPKLAYLMETPQEEFAAGVADKESALRAFDDAIRAKRDTQGALPDSYVPQTSSTLSHST